MIKKEHMLRRTAAVTLAVMLAASPAAMAGDSTMGVGAIASATGEAIGSAMGQVQGAHEGFIHIEVEDPMRAAISEYAGNMDDMAWIENAELLMQADRNESDGEDVEFTLFFNDAELYHLQLSYDGQENVLYALCPELLDKPMALPFKQKSGGDSQSSSIQIPPEVLEEAGTLLTELGDFVSSIPPETIQQSIISYVGTLASYITAEQGIATVTAGTLSAETNTVTYKISAEDMKAMLPQLLQLLSEDQVLKQALESDLVNHLLSLAMRQSGAKIQLTGSDIYAMIQPQIAKMAESDFSGAFGCALTVGTDNQGQPASLSLAIETSGVTAELFSISKVVSGADHAVEFKLGPVFASALGLDTNSVSGLVIQGSADQQTLNETVSLNVNGTSVPVFQLEDLDLAQLQEGKVSGKVSFAVGAKMVSLDLYEAEDGSKVEDVYVNDDLWCTVASDLYAVNDIELDEMDISEAVEVTDEESFAAYMRGAKVTRMIEKLADAGVPQEYIDKLNSGEASTESSRENVEETDAAS